MKDRPSKSMLVSYDGNFPCESVYYYENREHFIKKYQDYVQTQSSFDEVFNEDQFLFNLWLKVDSFELNRENAACIEAGYFLKKYENHPVDFFFQPFKTCKSNILGCDTNYKTEFVMGLNACFQIEEILEEALQKKNLVISKMPKGKIDGFMFNNKRYSYSLTNKDFIEDLASIVVEYLSANQNTIRYEIEHGTVVKQENQKNFFGDALQGIVLSTFNEKQYKNFIEDLLDTNLDLTENKEYDFDI